MSEKVVQLYDKDGNNIFPITSFEAMSGSETINNTFVQKSGDVMTGNLKVPNLDIANDICRGYIYGETNSLNLRGGNPTTEKYTYLKIAEDGVYIDNQKIYYPGNKPTPADIGVYSKTETDTLLQKKADKDQVVNPNLLDNWYFGNPVNQRGQTSYSANGYTIDRWRSDHNISYGTLTVDKTTGCVTLSHADDGGFVDFVQYLENPPTEIVTLSVLMLSGNLYSATGTLGNISLNADEIYIRSGELNSVVFRCKTGKTISIIAAKLELGSQQTLAHQDANGNWVLNEIPDYGEQLRRCQRYFVNFNPYKMAWFAMPPAVASNTTQAYSAVILPVAMRTQPVVSYGGNIVLSQAGDHLITDITISNSTFTGNSIQLKYDVSAGTLTANSTYRVQGGKDTTSYIYLSADL